MSARKSTTAVQTMSDRPPTKTWVLCLVVTFMSLSFASLLVLPDTRSMVHRSAMIYLNLMGSWIAWLIIPGAVLTLRYVIKLDNKLRSLDKRWLEWSPFNVKMNIAAVPISVKYLGIPYVLILLYSLPFMAWVEEMLFRYTVDNWLMPNAPSSVLHWVMLGCVGLLWSGLVFGVVHLVSLVTIRMTLCLSFAGVVLLAVYLVTSNIWVATAFHATYNIIAVGWIVFELRHKEQLQELLGNVEHRARIDRHVPTIAGWADKWVQPQPAGATN